MHINDNHENADILWFELEYINASKNVAITFQDNQCKRMSLYGVYEYTNIIWNVVEVVWSLVI